MKKNKYLFKSQLRPSKIIAACLVAIWISWSCNYLLDMSIGPSILLGVLFIYSFLAIYASRYYFYEEQIVRVFIFRLVIRRKVFKYEQLHKVKYEHIATKGAYPKFIVYQTEKQNLKYFNSFVFNNHAERVKVVKFLASKKVKIDVESDFEKLDYEIITYSLLYSPKLRLVSKQ